MSGRVVLVTGAARGIGAATVRHLVAAGDRVVAFDSCEADTASVDYSLATAQDLAAVAAAGGDAVHPVVGDVRDPVALKDAVRLGLARWGRIDAAVANAAVIVGGRPLWESSPHDLDLLWDVDVKGVWNTAAAAIPAMLDNADPVGCRFVAVSSAAGTHGLHGLAAYTAAKHAVVGLVKGLAADLVGTGVTACAVSPGSTRTPMLAATAALYGMAAVDGFADHQLVRRLLEPDDLAATIAHCCSRDGAVHNGSVVLADGGFTP